MIYNGIKSNDIQRSTVNGADSSSAEARAQGEMGAIHLDGLQSHPVQSVHRQGSMALSRPGQVFAHSHSILAAPCPRTGATQTPNTATVSHHTACSMLQVAARVLSDDRAALQSCQAIGQRLKKESQRLVHEPASGQEVSIKLYDVLLDMSRGRRGRTVEHTAGASSRRLKPAVQHTAK